MNLRCVVDAKNELGETPLWCERSQTLWWIDIEQPRLQSFVPANGRRTEHAFDARFLGSVALREQGGFLIALDLALHLFDPVTGALEPFARVEYPSTGNRLNDGRCDRQGRFWVGAMDIDLVNPKGGLYRVDADRTVSRHFSGIKLPNSIAVSPDQKTLYCSDTRSYVLWAFDFEAVAGVVSNPRVLHDFTAARDRPDGLCVDAEGHLWLAIFAGSRLLRLRPDGTIDRVVELPVTNPTCACLGGADLRTLYISTARKYLTPEQRDAEPWAGALLAMEVDVPGLPEARFAG